MKQITVSAVRTKKELMRFIRFPWKIYKNDPHWVPPLIMDRKKLLSKEKNPFYKHADIEMYIAEKDGEIAGRIAAITNDLHNKFHNDKVGFFGFFECINDQEVADALFNKAEEWLKTRGKNAMRGPANPSSNDEYGMLLEGFDDSPRLLMTYNPPYYLSLCENYGLKKAKDLYAYKIEQEKVLSSEKLKRVAEVARQRSKIQISTLNLKDFNNELNKVKEVYNKAWAPNWGFVPLTEDEMDALAKDLKPLVDPSIVLFGEIEGKVAGFALVMPDYNFVFKKMNGRLFPFGFLRLLSKNRQINWARILILGIVPEFQKKGLDAVFYWEIVNRTAQRGINLGEASWVLEDNEMMKRGAEVMGGTLYKKYRIYEKEI